MGWLRVGFGLWQGAVMLGQVAERREKYEAARAYAEAVGKPLLVVGGPYGDNPFRCLLGLAAHGHGDVCLDIEAGACEGAPETVVADVREGPFPDGHFGAALASHVLEHLPSRADCERAVRELQRVADRVYVAGPSRQSVIAWLVPGHHLWVEEEGGVLYVEERTWWSRAAGRDPREWDGLR